MDTFSISLIQSDIAWENPMQNLKNFEEKIQKLEGQTDLILIPEMFSTGFSVNSKNQAEPMNGQSVRWMQKMAANHKMALGGSVNIIENGNCFNRFFFVKPLGEMVWYDKRHLFRMSGENENFTHGEKRVIVEYKGIRFLLQTCYDIRFPVFMRNRGDYDAILVVASWPEIRIDVWKKLLYARAIENLSYVAAVNRVGVDGFGFNHSGASVILDYKGNELATSTPNKEEIITAKISKTELDDFRNKYPAALDADKFDLML
jgi:predicted amidohydrolase